MKIVDRIEERHQHLDLSDLRKGDLIKVVAGSYRYNFEILEKGKWPLCTLIQTTSRGVVGPTEAILEGTGHWTTRKENPVQTPEPELQMLISHGWMNEGASIIIIDPKHRNRYELMPACTEIIVSRKKPKKTRRS